jgi:carbon-monoxide dehydrogenase large subunit
MVLSSQLGAAVKRKEDPRLITGASTYVDDIELPRMVHAAFVRSPYPHATLNGIDVAEALALPGVLAVFTEHDLRGVMPDNFPTPGGETGEDQAEDAEEEGIPVPDVYPLACGKVRYIGEPVAVVIAESRKIADDAAQLVTVDAESLEAVVDPYAAMKDGSPLVYDQVKNNISVREATEHGDVEAALAGASIRVKANIRSPRCHAVPMEARGIVAQPDAILGGLTFWTSTQAPHWNRNDIAKALRLSRSTWSRPRRCCSSARSSGSKADRKVSWPPATVGTSGPSSKPARMPMARSPRSKPACCSIPAPIPRRSTSPGAPG